MVNVHHIPFYVLYVMYIFVGEISYSWDFLFVGFLIRGISCLRNFLFVEFLVREIFVWEISFVM